MKPSAVFTSLLPVWMTAILLVVAPKFFGGVLLNPPAMLGLPVGVVLLAIAAALTALGFLAMRGSTSPIVSALAFTFLTLPAVFLVIFTPAVVMIGRNLAAEP
jgi:ABC-type transport system involved in cytochrome c biogenesis permease subunit